MKLIKLNFDNFLDRDSKNQMILHQRDEYNIFPFVANEHMKEPNVKLNLSFI